MALGQFDNQPARAQEQFLAVRVGSHDRAVAWQREAQRLGQTVHRVCRKHAGAGTAGGACRALHFRHIRIGHRGVTRLDHRIDQVELDDLLLVVDDLDHLARFHGTAGHEHHRNIEAHRSHQHSGRDLVAVRDAHHRIGAVRVDHVFDGVGDQIARRQRVQHAAMPHRDAVVHGNRIEFLRNTACRFDLARHQLAQILQVHVPRHKLRERIDDGDNRLFEIAILHAGGAPQRARSRHVAALGRGT
ncbi:hypothetical protein FEMY_24150 [Ferrovum myxofaciens]|uniref:Uncharacterized protein n=1 Tax=Ferrovum myxofaciens TaxID=416213 RepID=A0A149VV64_9PROT|nr:hypothetical protein FEMY_24150 [Ferrovum myxofaciens]